MSVTPLSCCIKSAKVTIVSWISQESLSWLCFLLYLVVRLPTLPGLYWIWILKLWSLKTTSLNRSSQAYTLLLGSLQVQYSCPLLRISDLPTNTCIVPAFIMTSESDISHPVDAIKCCTCGQEKSMVHADCGACPSCCNCSKKKDWMIGGGRVNSCNYWTVTEAAWPTTSRKDSPE